MFGDLNIIRFILLVLIFFCFYNFLNGSNVINILFGWYGSGLVSSLLVIYYYEPPK